MPKETIKKLVVYYSLNGNSKFIAESIADQIGADLLELKLQNDIKSKGFLKYFLGGKQVLLKEKPALLPFEKKPQDYDCLFIGTPVWAGSFAPALATFFVEAQLKGKKVALFCCYGGQAGKTFVNMKKYLEGNEFIGQMGFKEPLKHDKEENAAQAKQWAKEIITNMMM